MTTVGCGKVNHVFALLRWLLLGCRLAFFSSSARSFLLACCCNWSGGWLRRSARPANHRNHGVHLDCRAFIGFDLAQDASGRRGDFGVYLVCRDFKQRLVALDFVADLLEPLGDSAFKDRLPHLGHDYVSWHESLPQV